MRSYTLTNSHTRARAVAPFSKTNRQQYCAISDHNRMRVNPSVCLRCFSFYTRSQGAVWPKSGGKSCFVSLNLASSSLKLKFRKGRLEAKHTRGHVSHRSQVSTGRAASLWLIVLLSGRAALTGDVTVINLTVPKSLRYDVQLWKDKLTKEWSRLIIITINIYHDPVRSNSSSCPALRWTEVVIASLWLHKNIVKF